MRSVIFGLVSLLGLTGLGHAQVSSDEYDNTGMGTGALGGSINSACQIGESSSSKCYNTAAGYAALGSISTGGNYNTGTGFVVLYQNTSGFYNTASGAGALEQNTTGNGNTAIGFGALSSNIFGNNDSRSTGSFNTASGAQSLYFNTTGYENTASGAGALYSNSIGTDNNAMGFHSLYLNTEGYRNSAVGSFALAANTTGNLNNATGYGALAANTSGSNNNAQGYLALASNTTGSFNTAIGEYAGYFITTGNHNIDIGNLGAASDNGVIRIGGSATAAYISGISNSTVTGAAVYVTSSGQLGVLASSERYKTAIAPMGFTTDKLQRLRPVTFHLKNDPKGDMQYGLIAEEVAQVYPELVIRNAAGRIDGVRYDELAPMLLNEVQKQAAEIRGLKRQQDRFAAQAQQLRDLQQQLVSLQAALQKLQTRDKLVAQR